MLGTEVVFVIWTLPSVLLLMIYGLIVKCDSNELRLSGHKSDTGKLYIDRLGDRVGTAST